MDPKTEQKSPKLTLKVQKWTPSKTQKSKNGLKTEPKGPKMDPKLNSKLDSNLSIKVQKGGFWCQEFLV